MDYATQAARDAIAQFTTDEAERTTLALWLSEIPIGDEYGMLSEDQWKLGFKFQGWAEQRGIVVFRDERGNGMFRHGELKRTKLGR